MNWTKGSILRVELIITMYFLSRYGVKIFLWFRQFTSYISLSTQKSRKIRLFCFLTSSNKLSRHLFSCILRYVIFINLCPKIMVIMLKVLLLTLWSQPHDNIITLRFFEVHLVYDIFYDLVLKCFRNYVSSFFQVVQTNHFNSIS